jgi:methylamine dehydrogenase heavy chain
MTMIRTSPTFSACGTLLFTLLLSGAHAAELPAEPLTAGKLPEHGGAHWVWMNDAVFQHMADGKAYLLDGDSGRFLGMLSTGYGFNGVVLPGMADWIYSPESYFSRGTRGSRTDVITIYSGKDLGVVAEINIPPKRSSQLGLTAAAGLTDDDRFLLVYNFTPAQSVTVVDMTSRKAVGEIETAGCALVYVTGARSFFSICADGSLLAVTLDDTGHVAGSHRTAASMFDVAHDPVSEKAVRLENTWWFASFKGQMYTIDATPGGLKIGRQWWLTSPEERAEGWITGGAQHLALHRRTRRLYAVMHRGGPNTRKDPGREIWVYDLDAGRRLQRIATPRLVSSIAVSQDPAPLLFACFIGGSTLDVYDAGSGTLLRSVENVGASPTTLVTR